MLRKKSAPIKKVSIDIRTLIKDMFETMDANYGQGLAAPQVGVLKRVIVVDSQHDEEEERRRFALINPKIKSYFGEREGMDEGCLSIPGVYGPVIRAFGAHVDYQDEKGRKKKIEAKGMLARCIQHEIDHLNGILFFDHSNTPEKQMISEMEQFLAEQEEIEKATASTETEESDS